MPLILEYTVGRKGAFRIHVIHVGTIETQLSSFDGKWTKTEAVS